MKPESNAELSELNEVVMLIHGIIQKKELPAGLAAYFGQYPALEILIKDLTALCEFAVALSSGDLSQNLPLRGYFAGALKALQSNLRHLGWQSSMVAAGDYSQRVDFMGDFSVAFNTMIVQLQTATENERRYIAELEKSQAVIAESERKYRLIAENTDDVIWLMDQEMKLQYMSPSIEKLLGYGPEDFLGKPVSETPLPFLQTVFQNACAALATAEAAAAPLVEEREQTRKDTTMIWTESLVTVARNEAGAFVGFLGVTRDISERKKSESLLLQAYERRKKADFFNRLVAGGSDDEILAAAWNSKIYIPRCFSLFFLTLANLDDLAGTKDSSLYRKQQIIEGVVDFLSRTDATIAWDTDTLHGIGIIRSVAGEVQKQWELDMARRYFQEMSHYFPELVVHIGTADYRDGWTEFACRLEHAKTALLIGEKIWPEKGLYHYEDCGIYQVLAPFAGTQDAARYVHKLLGPLIEHDQAEGNDLLPTLERLLAGQSFKEIGAQMYLHHKTIQLRKQRIEQILNLSLDESDIRMALTTAIRLRKIIT